MNVVTVDLDDEQDRLLRSLAVEEGRPAGEIVREAVSEYLARRGADSAPRVIEPPHRIPREEWEARFDAVLQRMRAGVDPTWTPEEIEADITAAREEVRQERAARRRASGG